MDEREEIIVLQYFDNTIEGNLAKTKLDAYGVPCFLTEENLSNLYPGQSLIGFKVRLHIFANDKERASQILSEGNLTIEKGTLYCPKCHSSRTTRDFPKQFAESLTYIFLGVLFPHKKVNHCLDCDCEF